jgi:hypothetical protein
VKAEHIEFLLKQLRCDKINNGGEWVYSSCPLAQWKHKLGKDSHPSFSVAVDAKKVSGARCHACHFSGSLLELLWKIQALAKKDMSDLLEFVRANNGPSALAVIDEIKRKRAKEVQAELTPEKPSAPHYDWNREVAGIQGVQVDWLAKLGDEKDLPVLPADALKKFVPCSGDVLDYLTGEGEALYDGKLYGLKRRLTHDMLRDWEVCWDKSFHKIIIPVRDCKQRLVGYSQRAFVEKEAKVVKYMHTKGFRRDFYLYGEQFWKPGKKGLLVEGFFDAMRLRSYGYQVGACMGTHLSDFQVEKFVRYFEQMIVVSDGDEPGYKAAAQWFEKLSMRLPTKKFLTPEGMDPDDFSPEQARQWLGDPS